MAAIDGFWRKAIAFLLKFFAIYAILQFLIMALPLYPLESGIAGIEAKALGLQASGNNVLFSDQGFEIAENCTGLMSAAVLAAIVFSLRKPALGKKALLFAGGAIALFFANLLRVYLVLAAALSFGTAAAETLHVVSWFAMSALILLLWYWLTKRIAKAKEFAELL